MMEKGDRIKRKRRTLSGNKVADEVEDLMVLFVPSICQFTRSSHLFLADKPNLRVSYGHEGQERQED